MLRTLVASDFLRVRYGRLYRIFLGYAALVAAICILWTDAWVVVPRGTEIYGFFHNLMGWETELYRAGYGTADLTASASVAHTLFFTVYTILLAHAFYGSEIQSRSVAVTFAHGTGIGTFLTSKILVATVVLQGSYLLVSGAVAFWI